MAEFLPPVQVSEIQKLLTAPATKKPENSATDGKTDDGGAAKQSDETDKDKTGADHEKSEKASADKMGEDAGKKEMDDAEKSEVDNSESVKRDADVSMETGDGEKDKTEETVAKECDANDVKLNIDDAEVVKSVLHDDSSKNNKEKTSDKMDVDPAPVNETTEKMGAIGVDSDEDKSDKNQDIELKENSEAADRNGEEKSKGVKKSDENESSDNKKESEVEKLPAETIANDGDSIPTKTPADATTAESEKETACGESMASTVKEEMGGEAQMEGVESVEGKAASIDEDEKVIGDKKDNDAELATASKKETEKDIINEKNSEKETDKREPEKKEPEKGKLHSITSYVIFVLH